jgi:regulator of protease activity HflC (stomatin/prohibitin superfamily)
MFYSIEYPPEVKQAIIAKHASEEQLEAARIDSQTASLRWEAQKKEVEAKAEINAAISKGLDLKILQLKYIQALEKLANSSNGKIVVYSNGELQLPLFEKIAPKKK